MDFVLFVVFQMNIIAGGFYDGLMLYTHALNETMSMSGGQPPGKVVTERMWNRTFHGWCIFYILGKFLNFKLQFLVPS